MEPLELVGLMGRIFDSIDVPWVLGGSMASSIAGEPRSTMDIDMAVRLDLGGGRRFVDLVTPDFYVSLDMIRDAVARRSSFSILQYESMMKVDVFVLGDDLLDRRQMDRRRRVVLMDPPGLAVWVGSIEDQVLRKLRWFRMGHEVSDRQWRDVLGILTVQATAIDLEDVQHVASLLGLDDLLHRALIEAGLAGPGPTSGR